MTTLPRPAPSDSEDRWAREILAMAVSYPAFRYVEREPRLDLISREETPLAKLKRTECGPRVRTWTGPIKPFASGATMAEIESILSDLNDGLVIDIGLNGTLRHAAKCDRVHVLAPELRPARRIDQAYTVEIAARTPPGHPIVRGIDPLILPDPPLDEKKVKPQEGRRALQRIPHLSEPLKALCVMFPSDGSWDWERGDGIVASADQTAFWLAKYIIWQETKQRLGPTNGIWLGPGVPHGPLDLLRAIGPDDPCRCGSGRTYSRCCYQKDLAQAFEEGLLSEIFRS